MTVRPRVRIPSPIKAGQVIEVRTLVSHVMETGQRRGPDGKPVPRNIIHTFEATYNGAPVFKAELQPGISANPYLAFHLRVDQPGEIVMTWTDDSGAEVVERTPVAFS